MHPVFNCIFTVLRYNITYVVSMALLVYLLSLDNYISTSISDWGSCKSYTLTQLLLGKVMTTFVCTISCSIMLYIDYQNDINGLIGKKRLQNPARKKISSINWKQYKTAIRTTYTNAFVYETIYWIFVNSYLLNKRGVICDSFWFEAYSYTQIAMFIIIKLPLLLFLSDLYFYATHRLLHEVKFLYKYIHKIHHTYINPMAVSVAACHPFEDLFGNVGSASVPCIMLGVPLGFFYFWYCVAVFNGAMSHSGYRLKFAARIGAIPHDWHHQYTNVHFGAGGYCDYIFKTRLKDLYPDAWKLIQKSMAQNIG